jgi:hypothetical protein
MSFELMIKMISFVSTNHEQSSFQAMSNMLNGPRRREEKDRSSSFFAGRFSSLGALFFKRQVWSQNRLKKGMKSHRFNSAFEIVRLFQFVNHLNAMNPSNQRARSKRNAMR